MTDAAGSIMALDVGEKRIGVALTSLAARLPGPLVTLKHNDDFVHKLQSIIEQESVITLVVGWPRGLNGQHTAQTSLIEDFTSQLHEQLNLPIYFQDEALTSRKAEAELLARGKPYEAGEIDALAATYILEDYLSEHQT